MTTGSSATLRPRPSRALACHPALHISTLLASRMLCRSVLFRIFGVMDMAAPAAEGFSPVCLICELAPHHDGAAKPPRSFWSALHGHLPPTHPRSAPLLHRLHCRLCGNIFQTMPTPSISLSSHPPASEANFPIGRPGRPCTQLTMPSCAKPSLTPCQSRPLKLLFRLGNISLPESIFPWNSTNSTSNPTNSSNPNSSHLLADPNPTSAPPTSSNCPSHRPLPY